MSEDTRYGLEQARARLPHIVAEAATGVYTVITRHGRACAAVVPMQALEKLQAPRKRQAGLLALRGSGRGLWGPSVGRAVAELRDEWGSA